MNAKLGLYSSDQRLMIGEGVHQLAQVWGINFVRHFLETGTKVEDAYQSALLIYTLEHQNHLTHCWENDHCHEIRELVDATNLYCREDYLYYCHRKLVELEIIQSTSEPAYLLTARIVKA